MTAAAGLRHPRGNQEAEWGDPVAPAGRAGRAKDGGERLSPLKIPRGKSKAAGETSDEQKQRQARRVREVGNTTTSITCTAPAM